MKNLDISDLKKINFKKALKPFEKIGRQHFFIICMLLILVLAAVFYVVFERVKTIEKGSVDEPTPTTIIQFNKQTIQELNDIGDGDRNYTPPVDKRLSPFAE